jgi:catalase
LEYTDEWQARTSNQQTRLSSHEVSDARCVSSPLIFADDNSHNRDGQGRHRITAGKVNYWPNRFEAVPPVPPSEGGFKSYPEKVQGMVERLRSKKFAEHINQAQFFYNSLTRPEKLHLEKALGFELDHCDEAIVYERICDRLRVRFKSKSLPTDVHADTEHHRTLTSRWPRTLPRSSVLLFPKKKVVQIPARNPSSSHRLISYRPNQP